MTGNLLVILVMVRNRTVPIAEVAVTQESTYSVQKMWKLMMSRLAIGSNDNVILKGF